VRNRADRQRRTHARGPRWLGCDQDRRLRGTSGCRGLSEVGGQMQPTGASYTACSCTAWAVRVRELVDSGPVFFGQSARPHQATASPALRAIRHCLTSRARTRTSASMSARDRHRLVHGADRRSARQHQKQFALARFVRVELAVGSSQPRPPARSAPAGAAIHLVGLHHLADVDIGLASNLLHQNWPQSRTPWRSAEVSGASLWAALAPVLAGRKRIVDGFPRQFGRSITPAARSARARVGPPRPDHRDGRTREVRPGSRSASAARVR